MTSVFSIVTHVFILEGREEEGRKGCRKERKREGESSGESKPDLSGSKIR